MEAIDSPCNREDVTRIELCDEWVEWIRWYANCLCPLTKTPVRDEFLEKPDNAEIANLLLTKETSRYLQSAPYKDTDELFAAGHDEVSKHFGHHSWSAMREIRDVLEGRGYDVSGYGHAFY